jgi:simple sugar transport system substrate-binding protein
MENPTVPESVPPKKQGSVLSVIIPWVLFFVVLIGAGAYFYMTKVAKGASTGAPTAKMCQGVNIVYFAGGSEGDPVPSVITNGVKQAQRDLGPNIEYVYSGWISSKMVEQFKDAIQKNPDAIALMGHAGSAELSPFIDEAERKGIIVTMQNVDLPEIRQKYIDKGFGYAGADLYKFGLELGKGVVRKFNLKKDDKAVVLLAEPVPATGEVTGRALMGKGDIDGLKAGGLTVYSENIPSKVNEKPDSPEGDAFVAGVIAKYAGLKVIIADHGELTAALGPILRRLGKKPGEFIVGGYDISPKTVAEIQSGYVGLVRDQQLYLEGYLPILQSCLTKKYGFAGLFIDTGVGLVDNSNVGSIVDLVKQQIR